MAHQSTLGFTCMLDFNKSAGFFEMISSSNPDMLPVLTINDFDESYCEVQKG